VSANERLAIAAIVMSLVSIALSIVSFLL